MSIQFLSRPEKKYASFIIAGSLSALLTACGGSSSNTDSDNFTDFSLNLSSLQTVPGVNSSGTGDAKISLDEGTGEIKGSFTTTGLSSKIKAAHIHNAEAGLNGGIIIAFEKSANDDTWEIPAESSLDNTQIAAFLAGKMYINVHTIDNGSGEVRGQITPTAIKVIRTSLDGQQQPIPVTTGASAVGYVTINTNTRAISANLRTTDLGSANAAHIHSGFAGTNGGIIVGFEQDGSDVSLWKLPAGKVLTVDQLAQLNAGGTYYNIHNTANGNPAGEVRGQIAPEDIKVIRSALDGTQQVPSAATDATGVGYTTVNISSSAITANIRTFGLADTATLAHIHQAAAGTNGGIKIGFEQDANDTSVWSSPVGSTLDADLLTAFNNDDLYFNVHTSNIPSGEVRGQITP